VSLERGTRSGAPRTGGPADSGTRLALVAVVGAASLVLSIVLAIGALTPGTGTSTGHGSGEIAGRTGSPEPTLPATPTPSAELVTTSTPRSADTPQPLTPLPSPDHTDIVTPQPTIKPPSTVAPTPRSTPRPSARAGDPADLTRYPGSRLEERERSQRGDLAILTLEYSTPARLDRVRRHYRTMLRRHGWFVGDVELDDDGWEIEANKGTREASIEIQREDGRTEVEIEISWPAG